MDQDVPTKALRSTADVASLLEETITGFAKDHSIFELQTLSGFSRALC
jgi:hypothetical protein